MQWHISGRLCQNSINLSIIPIPLWANNHLPLKVNLHSCLVFNLTQRFPKAQPLLYSSTRQFMMHILCISSLHKEQILKSIYLNFSYQKHFHFFVFRILNSFSLGPDFRKYLCLWLSVFNYFYESDVVLWSNFFFSNPLILWECSSPVNFFFFSCSIML